VIHTFVLILTLVGVPGNAAAPVPALTTAVFPSKETCLAAGTAWLKQVPDTYRLEARALCVPQS
jgi:hypothetical protein